VESILPKFTNPYRPGQIPASPAEFFNREDTIAWLEQQIIARRRLMILHGLPLIGKTTLLRFLPQLLGIDALVVNIPMADLSEISASALINRIHRQAMLEMAAQDFAMPDVDAGVDAVNALSRTFADFESAHPKTLLLVALDDFDTLAQNPAETENFLSACEAFITRYKNLNFVLTAQSTAMSTLLHPMLATAPTHQIPPLKLSDALQMISKPVEKTLRFDYGVPKRIADFCSNHPHYLTVFCHTLFTRNAREGWVNLRDLDTTLDEVLARPIPSFEKMWQESTLVERAVLVAMANLKGSHGLSLRQEIVTGILRHDKKAQESVILTALESLSYRGVLVKMGALSYRFFVDLFRHWVQRQFSMAAVLAEVSWDEPAARPHEVVIEIEEEPIEDEAAEGEPSVTVSTPIWLLVLLSFTALAVVAAALVFLPDLLSGKTPSSPAPISGASTVVVPAYKTPTPVPSFTPTSAPADTPTPTPPIVVAKSLPSIAYMAREGEGLWQIYMMNTDGSDAHSISDGQGDDTSPMWSPDDSRIVMVSQRDGNREIYVMNADGSNPHNITNNPADDWTPAWSPDGTQVAYSSNRTGGWEIYVDTADGGAATQLTDGGSNISPVWSPDGARLVFSSKRNGNWEIYSMRVDGSDVRRLTQSEGSDLAPVWSPDGQMIAFESNVDGNMEVYVMSAAGGNPRNISQLSYADDQGPVWSPDGQRLLFYSNREGNWDLFLTDLTGKDVVNLTNTPNVNEQIPVWRP